MMAKARIITYECEHCGNEVVVTSTGEGVLSPIYCCGIEVAEISASAQKPAKPKKKPAKKPVKKKTAKKAAPKKKPSSKKKTAKK
ncbi:MAG: hypothetical protein AB1552_08230 [Nitrospirota bacterium]